MPTPAPNNLLPHEFRAYFEDGAEAGTVRLTAQGASALLPRFARHGLTLVPAGEIAVVHDSLTRLREAERVAGMRQLERLLQRPDLSCVEREALSALQDWQAFNARPPEPVAASGNQTAEIIDLAKWRGATNRSSSVK